MRLRLILFAASVLTGALVTQLLPMLLRALGLQRTNFSGHPIGSGGGVLFLLSVLPWFWLPAARAQWPAVGAVVGFGLLGLLDDRWGTAEHKGLRGHLRGLRSGRVTTGLVKAAGGGLLACTLAWLIRPSAEAVVSAPVIALTANAFNLLDLRPLRALKAFWLLAVPLLLPGPAVCVQIFGLSLPYARLEAQRRVMLGDTGANALGALLGLTACLVLPPWAQCLCLAALVGLHAWAEKHSISAWIDARPWARALDGWGWRPRAG